MTASIYDRIWQTSTTTGTGDFAVNGAAPTGFRAFGAAMLADPEYVYYTIEHQSADEWEVGYGSFTTSGTDTLTRTQVLSSSNAGALVSFSAGTKNVRLDIPADLFKQIKNDNVVINGDFNVWQRGTSFAAATNTYTADRWRFDIGSTVAVYTLSRSTDVPTLAQSGHLSNYSLLADCTTLDASIAAGDFAHIVHPIEGYVFQRIAQKPFVLSFWVKATKTGIYTIAFTNSVDRCYVAEYTINTTATWEKKTIVILASPSGGTWNYTNGLGVYLTFNLVMGSTYHTTAGAWQSTVDFATSNQVNAADSTSNDFRLAQVKIEPGNLATPFAPRLFIEDLRLCQRYYWKSFNYGTAPAQNSGVYSFRYKVPVAGTGYDPYFIITNPVSMRTSTATLTTYNPGAANALWRNLTDGSDSGAVVNVINYEDIIIIGNDQVAADGLNDVVSINFTVDQEM